MFLRFPCAFVSLLVLSLPLVVLPDCVHLFRVCSLISLSVDTLLYVLLCLLSDKSKPSSRLLCFLGLTLLVFSFCVVWIILLAMIRAMILGLP